MSSLYNRDFNLWIQKTVSDLKSKDLAAIDWENLIDEIEGMGKSDRRAECCVPDGFGDLRVLTALQIQIAHSAITESEWDTCLRYLVVNPDVADNGIHPTKHGGEYYESLHAVMMALGLLRQSVLT